MPKFDPSAVVCRKVAAVCRAIQKSLALVVRNGSERQQADGDYSGDAEGSGMVEFSRKFPDRYFDVGLPSNTQ